MNDTMHDALLYSWANAPDRKKRVSQDRFIKNLKFGLDMTYTPMPSVSFHSQSLASAWDQVQEYVRNDVRVAVEWQEF